MAGFLCLLLAAAAQGDPLDLPFELGKGDSAYHAWGSGRLERSYAPEFLPPCFERTLELDSFDAARELKWVFTGPRAGITLTLRPDRVTLQRRHYDSFAFNRIQGKDGRHPEWAPDAREARLEAPPRAVTVRMDHRLRFTVLVDGRETLFEGFLDDLHRHQLQLGGKEGVVRGRLKGPAALPGAVRVDPSRRGQEMIGFGGIAIPTAYALLSPEGKRRWWDLLLEYNLLIQREYPIGVRLNPAMDNWDRPADATPHYYADNFPNGEISDFDYLRELRRLGGQVWFEFWGLPPWAGADAGKYAEAMVRYCRVSKERAGAPPEIVGIQNEVTQKPEQWHAMTLALRRALDGAGFRDVRIHMSDDPTLKGGIGRARAFARSKEAWDAVDYSASHMYDYQNCFDDPDRFDATIREWKEASGGKPFLSTELCINHGKYQLPSYRMALTMGQLYHKNLVLAEASAVCYCWTLLNVEQPSYGATRSLCVPDPEAGFLPAASSHQLRVFGAWSRRIRRGMRRVEALAEEGDLLVSAFEGDGGRRTLVALNRGSLPRRLRVLWPGGPFTEMERTGPYHANAMEPAAAETLVEGGTIVTLTNVPLGKAGR